MSHTVRRFYSSTAAPTANAIATEFLATTQALPPQVKPQLADINQANKLRISLEHGYRERYMTTSATALPPGYHLVYFTPNQAGNSLGKDGSDTTFNPPKPFTRRMWAGGEIEWVERNKLRGDQTVTETTRLLSAEGKMTRAGEEMIVVGVEKKYENKNGLALVDKRNWIFRPEIVTPQPPAAKPHPVPLPEALEGQYTRDLKQTPESLFRFSALTFNAHKIHYNREWCRGVEGHRDLVVHGPLNLIELLATWRRLNRSKFPKKITYRATSPLYVGEAYRIVLDKAVDKVTEAKIVDSFGFTAMVGKIEES